MPVQDQTGSSLQNQAIPPVPQQPNIPQQPAAPQQPIAPQNTPMYAGFWLRWAAIFLDCWISAIPSALIGAIITVPLALISGEPISQAFGKPPINIIYNSLVVILVWSYFVFTTNKFGATLGKKVFKLQVIAENGNLTLSKVVIREIPGKIISGLILSIGYLMVIFSKEKQALHDHLAGTHVIRTEPVTGKTKLAIVLLIIFPILILIVLIVLIALPFFFVFFQPRQMTRFPQNNLSSTSSSALKSTNSGGLVSTFALSRDAERKNHIGNIATELQAYKITHADSLPTDLSVLFTPSAENPNPGLLPTPPNNSEPKTSYGYLKCSVDNKEQGIIYTKLEETGNYYVFRTSTLNAIDSGSPQIPACP